MHLEHITSLLSFGAADMRMVSRATGERWTQADAARLLGPYRNSSGRVVMLGERDTLAFRFRYLRDDSVRHDLKAFLLIEAIDVAERERWPETIKRMDPESETWPDERYIEDLVDLALLEEHHLWKISHANLWHIYMRVEPIFWFRALSRKYEAIRYFVELWCGTATSHIRRNIGSTT